MVDPNYYDPNWVDPNAYNGYENYYYTEPGGYPGGYYVSFTAAFREDYAYDAGGRLTEVRQVSGNYGSPTPTGPGGVVALIYYDVAGRQTRQIDYTAPNSWTMAYDQTTSYDAAGRVSSTYSETRQGNDIVRTTTNYNYGGTWQGGAYALGQIMSVTSNSHKNWSNHSNSTTTYGYAWYQGAVQQSINHTQTGSPAGNTWFSYNHVAGQAVMTQASISDGRSRTVNYATNLMGEVVKRWESASGTGGGAPAEYWYRYAGKEMGKVGNDGNLYNSYISSITQRQTQAGQGAFEFGRTGGTPEADFGSRLEGISSYNQGSAAGTITARGGETLQAVAASLWGDSGLWYKLAQANGLSGDAALSAGQTLRIPAGVVRNTFNAATITPTDPADTLGDVNPTSPQAAPPKKQKCGMIGTILLVVIAIAVVVASSGGFAGGFASMFNGGTFAAGWSAGAAASGGLAGAAAAGAAAAGAAATAATGLTAAAVLGGGIAAAAGSIVSQAVGVATGIQEKFSWKGVAMAFISGAIGGAGKFGVGGKDILSNVARTMVKSAASQAIGVTLGLQDKFSWAAVAAAGVGAGVAQAVGGTQFAQNLTAKSELAGDIYVGMADAMGQAATLSLIQGSDFGDNLIASLPSVLGGAIGRQVGGALSKTFAKTEEPKPLEIEPINDRIEVDLSRAGLDPVTAKLPPAGQQNVQNGPSNINAVRQQLALTPEGDDFQFRMQAIGFEAAQRRRDLTTIAGVEDLSGGPIDITSQFEEFARQNPKASRLLRLVHDPASSGRAEDASWTLDLLVAGIGGIMKVGAEGAFAKSSLWKLPWLERGNKIEVDALKSVGGRNGLHANFPVIDSLTSSGRAISVVSIGLSAKTYLSNPKAISNTLFAKLKKVADFATVRSVTYGKSEVIPKMVKSRELLVIIPKGPMTPAQQQALQAVYQQGVDKGVIVTIKKY